MASPAPVSYQADIEARPLDRRNSPASIDGLDLPSDPNKEWMTTLELDADIIADDLELDISSAEATGAGQYTPDQIRAAALDKIKERIIDQMKTDGQEVRVEDPGEEGVLASAVFRLAADTMGRVLGDRDYNTSINPDPDARAAENTAAADAARREVMGAVRDNYLYSPRLKNRPADERRRAIDIAADVFDSQTPETSTSRLRAHTEAQAAAQAANAEMDQAWDEAHQELAAINARATHKQVETNVAAYEAQEANMEGLQEQVALDVVRADAKIFRFSRLKASLQAFLHIGGGEDERIGEAERRGQLAEAHAEMNRLQVETEALFIPDTAVAMQQRYATLQAESFLSDVIALQDMTDRSIADPSDVHGRIMGLKMRLSRSHNRKGMLRKGGVAGATMAASIASSALIGPTGAALVAMVSRARSLNSARTQDRRSENDRIGEIWTKFADTQEAVETMVVTDPVTGFDFDALVSASGEEYRDAMNLEFAEMGQTTRRNFYRKAGTMLVMGAGVRIASELFEDQINAAYEWFRDDVIPDSWAEHLHGGAESLSDHSEHGLNTTPSDVEGIVLDHADGSPIAPGSADWNRMIEAMHSNQVNDGDLDTILGMMQSSGNLTETQKAELLTAYTGSSSGERLYRLGEFLTRAGQVEANGGGVVDLGSPDPTVIEALPAIMEEFDRSALFDVGIMQGHMPSPEVTNALSQAIADGGGITEVLSSPELFGIPPEMIQEYSLSQGSFDSFINHLDTADKDRFLQDIASNPGRYFSGNDGTLIKHWIEAYTGTAKAGFTVAA